MSNVNSPQGFSPAVTANWKRYFIRQADPHVYRVGDFVVSAGGSDAAGVVAVTLNPGNLPNRALIIAVDPANPTTGRDASGLRLSVPAMKTRDYYVWALDDPALEFIVQDDGLNPLNLVAANVGNAVNFNPAEGPGDLSKAVLTSATFGTGSVIQVLGLAPGSTIGPYAKWRCRSRLHELSAEAPGVTFDDLGGPSTVTAMKQLVASKWINKVGYSVLITGASTNARNNNEYNIPNEGSYSRDATGRVQFDCLSFPDCGPGRRIKVAHDNAPWTLALCDVISATDIGGGMTRIVAQEVLFGAPPRRVIGAGSTPSGLMVCHDMQASPSCMNWVTKTNMKCGGVLDVTNMAIGGSVPDDWNDPELQAYLKAMVAAQGPFDLHIWDCGYGNALTNPWLSADQLVAELVLFANTCGNALAKEQLFHSAGGARPGGDDGLEPTPWLTVDFTMAQRVNHYLRENLARLFSTCEFVDIEHAFQRFSLRGSTDTQDLAWGLVSNRILDKGGIHYANAGCDLVAEAFAQHIIPKLKRYAFGVTCRPDFVYLNTIPDLGSRYNPNGMLGWNGNCEVSTLPGGIGQAFTGITVNATGLNHNMVPLMSVENGEVRGRRQRLDFTDVDPATNGGALLQIKIASVKFGGVTYTIAQLLNDPKFSGPVDAWLDWACYGFNPDSVVSIQAGLFGHSASGTREIASWMANKGGNGAFGTQRGWTSGFVGPMRAGNSWFRIPQTETYDDGYILLQVQGLTGLGMGNMALEVNDFRIAARQALV